MKHLFQELNESLRDVDMASGDAESSFLLAAAMAVALEEQKVSLVFSIKANLFRKMQRLKLFLFESRSSP